MKFLIFIVSVVTCGMAYGAAPVTICPDGLTAIEETFMLLANSSCETGFTSVGTAESCLDNFFLGSCMMYVPAGMEYSDDTGMYQYAEICPLE